MQPERTTNIKKPSQLITTPRRWKMKPGFMQHYRNFLRLPRFYETYCITIFFWQQQNLTFYKAILSFLMG